VPRRPRAGAPVALAVALVAGLCLAASAQARVVRAESILPPGESGFVSVAGLPNGTGSPHLYDQQQPFIDFARKDAMFGQPGGSESPGAGVTITRDAFGVPSVTGDTTAHLWWGAGYATAQDRLFQLELFRRATTGHLAEILGKDYLPMDVRTRRDFYPPGELDAMLSRLPVEMRQRYASYLAGINAWVDHVLTSPTDLPGEFAAVGLAPSHFTLEDLAAIGVYMARTTPNTDGSEIDDMRALKASGADAFNRILPLRTPGQISTIPAADGLFPSVPGRTAAQESTALQRSAAFVASLPVPDPYDLGTEPAQGSAVPTPGTGPAVGLPGASLPPGVAAPLSQLVAPIRRGGSSMVAIGDVRTGRALLFSGPELGFTAPEELHELELHGPGLDARGITAPGAPVIAIGHNQHVAWGLTSGLTMTDHLYAEKLVPGHSDEYYFNGQARSMDCRTETFTYRSPPSALLDPTGLAGNPPSAGQESLRLCRTVHGPVQARVGGIAYARRYATWGREAETVVGLARVDTARSVSDVNRATSNLTWNENLMAADDRGHIGYWHPGLLPISPVSWDERLPYPGTGEAEWGGFLPVSERPHVIDPEQGWLSNWNNIPSQGWTTGNDPASERVAGAWFRVAWLNRLVAGILRRPTVAGLRNVIHGAGTVAEQRPLATPELQQALAGASGGAATVLRTILAWNGSYNDTDAAGKVDPGVAAWQELKDQAQKLALAPLGQAGAIIGGGEPNDEHVFDVNIGQAYALRALDAAGWRAVAAAAFRALSQRFRSANPSDWRTPRTMFNQSSQGAESPPPMPFFDRGTFEQIVQLGS